MFKIYPNSALTALYCTFLHLEKNSALFSKKVQNSAPFGNTVASGLQKQLSVRAWYSRRLWYLRFKALVSKKFDL